MFGVLQKPCMRRFVQCTDSVDGLDSGRQVPVMLSEDEVVQFHLRGVALCFNPTKGPIGEGDLFISTRRVIWLGSGDSAYDFDVPYIVLHAICRDESSYPQPCVYCQLDCSDDDADVYGVCGDDGVDEASGDEGGDGADAGDEGRGRDSAASDEVISEMYIVPSNENDLMSIFEALSQAALLNPDPPEEGEEEGDDELIFNVDEVNLGAEQARALQHLESVFVLPGEKNDDVVSGGDEDGVDENDND